MDVREAFNDFHSRLIPSEASLRHASQRAKVILRILNNDPELRPQTSLYSGSYAKATHIHPLKDLDIVVHYPLNDWITTRGEVYSPGRFLGKFFERMDRAFGHTVRVRRQRRSVGLEYADVSIDLVPALLQGGEDLDSIIPDRDTNGWVRTSIKRHLEFLAGRDKSYRPYGKTIRIIKAWKRAKRVRFPGFALELLVAKALDKKGTSDRLQVCVTNVLEFIVEEQLSRPVYFTDYFYARDVRPDGCPVMIFDPVNLSNNVAKAVTVSERDGLIRKAEKDLRLCYWALRAEEDGDNSLALKHWRAVLQDPFPAGPQPQRRRSWLETLFGS